MTLIELKAALTHILALEDQDPVKWARLEVLSERTYVRLMTEPDSARDFPREEVIGYLAGFNRRRADSRFADRQRLWLRGYLRENSSA